MDIIFLGGVLPQTEREAVLLKSIGCFQAAANVLQMGYINGLSRNGLIGEVIVINLPFIGSYPRRYRDLFYRPLSACCLEGNIRYINVPFFNLSAVKLFHRTYLSSKMLFRLLSSARAAEDYYVFCYSMHLPFLIACYLSKILNKRGKFCVIVPDLPEYMAARRGIGERISRIVSKLSYYIVNQMDSVVVITEQMASKFPMVANKIVIEGMSDNSNREPYSEGLAGSKRYFLYTGTLDRRYGIRNLVDSYIKSGVIDCDLIICGDGDDREYVIKASRLNCRIHYLGQIDRERVLDLQRDALVLINPRDNDSEYTKYSFPSKVIEYMTSGVPVLMYRLDGIPDEYYKYCFSIEPDADGMARAMAEVSRLSWTSLRAKGSEARDFILRFKTSERQIEKLLNSIIGCDDV
ncbi:glycosyltransferase [Castellaniella sp. FW104-16D08]|uniref:glycosyltransferase n=1 Tax=unclassified Castellaniella TaxID=2617606 RepID=UPI0033163867